MELLNDELGRYDVILDLLCQADNEDQRALESILIKHLSEADKEDYIGIKEGTRLPSLSSDTIAKRIFDPDEHPDRLNILLQNSFSDDSIDVVGSITNEGFAHSVYSKKVVFDIPAKLSDNRLSDTEIQVAAQDFVLERGQIYGSDLLTMRYAVSEGQKKNGLNYDNATKILLLFIMKHSPDVFKNAKTDSYIHKFDKMISDTGIEHETLCKQVYIQLDKCFKEFLSADTVTDYELLLAAMYDINNEKVLSFAEENDFLREIIKEVKILGTDKEVQTMLLAEKYAIADLNAVKSYERREGRAEGRAEGRVEGKVRGKEEQALIAYNNCIARNMSPEDAMAISGWDPDKQCIAP